MMINEKRFEAAIFRFDEANGRDPNRETYKGREAPKELLYAERMTAWLDRLAPEAPEAVRLAVRCQHIRRWEIPRDRYPMDRRGYHQWRTTLQEFHGRVAGEILKGAGYDDETIQRIQRILSKKELKADPETQLLEDVVCLVFLESYFGDFSKKHDRDKIVEIVRKTWKKMSPRAQQTALALPLSPDDRALVEEAVST